MWQYLPMTILDAVIYGPFYCFVAGITAQLLIQITDASDWRWANKCAIALAMVIATGAVWAVGNMSAAHQATGFRDYPEPPPIDYGRYTR
jgi:hypothetical protein